MSAPIQTVLIYGYGVMGRGVAKTFADAGFAAIVRSGRASKLTGLPANTTAVERLPEKAPDLIIDFVPEDVRFFGQALDRGRVRRESRELARAAAPNDRGEAGVGEGFRDAAPHDAVTVDQHCLDGCAHVAAPGDSAFGQA